ncbi:unnamed protein product [Rotaria socialis]|uniref:Uncharacterized protein n=1 Tax=Rotaria socialis TaxID=392032 RepID=A0A820YJN4_9BILA|nr:unnamed protein product [Rotaria socialis]CAF4832620.1 unnamed protein product [Rotaria socialis]
MKLTAAQKQKRNRENLKRKGRHNTVKAKNRERTQNLRSKLSDFQREQYRNHDAAARKRTRAANKHQSNASFGSKQSLGPSLHKRDTCHLSCKLKDDIVKFYCRDDISYQMPGKRDTIIARKYCRFHDKDPMASMDR